MPDNDDDRLHRHEEMIQGLARLWERQDIINHRLTLAIERIDQTLAQQAVFQGDVRTTLARLETILARLGQQGENGREP